MIAAVAIILIAFLFYAWVTGKRVGRIACFIALAPISLIPVVMVAQGAGNAVAKVVVLPVVSIILLVLAWMLSSAPRLWLDEKQSHYAPPVHGWDSHPMTLSLPAQPGRVRTALAKLWD
jgi:hypothetical protein